MTTSTNGIIAYGVICEDGYEFPWDVEEFDGYEEGWWVEENGFVNPHENPFDEKGFYKEGWDFDDPRTRKYFDARRDWKTENPMPFEIENYCSGDYAMYALCVPGSVCTARRGTPVNLSACYGESPVPRGEKLVEMHSFLEFLEKYKIEYVDGPDWFLMSYWG